MRWFCTVPTTLNERLPIPQGRLPELHPVSGLSQLNYMTPFNRVAYTDVSIRRKDLSRIIRQYPREAKAFAATLKSS
jgi:hypothetical protein